MCFAVSIQFPGCSVVSYLRFRCISKGMSDPAEPTKATITVCSGLGETQPPTNDFSAESNNQRIIGHSCLFGLKSSTQEAELLLYLLLQQCLTQTIFSLQLSLSWRILMDSYINTTIILYRHFSEEFFKTHLLLATYAKKFSDVVSRIINHVAPINCKDTRTTKRTMEKNS